MQKRFTPVRIQAVQTSQFHDRRQRVGESVDNFAQDLRRLFQKAYPTTARGSQEAEEMGQSVLANQFVAGLLSELEVKVAGTEGNLEKLLTKARFEEAKLRDLPPVTAQPLTTRPQTAQAHQTTPKNTVAPAPKVGETKPTFPSQSSKQCFHCGSRRHLAYQCPNCGRTKPP